MPYLSESSPLHIPSPSSLWYSKVGVQKSAQIQSKWSKSSAATEVTYRRTVRFGFAAPRHGNEFLIFSTRFGVIFFRSLLGFVHDSQASWQDFLPLIFIFSSISADTYQRILRRIQSSSHHLSLAHWRRNNRWLSPSIEICAGYQSGTVTGIISECCQVHEGW